MDRCIGLDNGKDCGRRSPGTRCGYCRVVWALAVSLMACNLTGCSLFVMAGKMIYGDPEIPSAFRTRTGVDLTKSEKAILVICSTPESIKSQMPSLDLDLSDSVTRRLKREGLNVVNPEDVARWVDDNGGRWDHVSDLAGHFDVDYIAHVDLDQFTCRADNSPSMYRGQAYGKVDVYEVRQEDGPKKTFQIFTNEFRTEYPPLYPLSSQDVSSETGFQQTFLGHVSTQLARYFHDYRPGAGI